jgi:lysyl-tRNA synthetase class I
VSVDDAKHIILNVFDGAKQPVHFAYNVFTHKNKKDIIEGKEEDFE